jgi:hypothetical protein
MDAHAHHTYLKTRSLPRTNVASHPAFLARNKRDPLCITLDKLPTLTTIIPLKFRWIPDILPQIIKTRGPLPDIHLGTQVPLLARGAVTPIDRLVVSFDRVVGTDGVALVVADTTHSLVGECFVGMYVVADGSVAAIRARQVFLISAEATVRAYISASPCSTR